jgi:hypothetical protein
MTETGEAGTVELAEGLPIELKGKLEDTRMSAEERAEYCANSMRGMYNFTALRALMLTGGDWDKANEICEEVEKLMVGFVAAEFYTEHEPGDSAELATDRPLRSGGITEEFRATRDPRNAVMADIMVMMNSYPRAHFKITKWSPEEAAYDICGSCPRNDSLNTVHEVSQERGMPSPLEGYDLFRICAGGAKGYAMAMPAIDGAGIKGMCKGDDHCEFRYFVKER